MEGAERWGVTVLQANAEMDAGDIWASVEFTMPRCAKSSLYRTEAAEAAVQAVLLAVARVEAGSYPPQPLDYGPPDVAGAGRPPPPAGGGASDPRGAGPPTAAGGER